MKKTATILCAVGLASAANAQSFVADLSGVGVDGATPTVINATNPDSGAITTIDFDITVETLSPSWGSEVEILLSKDNSSFSVFANGDGSGGADVNFGWGNTTDIFAFQGSFDATGQLADVNGDWTITLSDGFDDTGINPDHQYLAGSTVTVNSVPAPAGLALIGLGGLTASRRRR